MLHKASRIRGVSVRGVDGEVGKVEDLYFDDKYWAIRFLVVRAGDWLTGRSVLISPVSVVPPWNTAGITLKLTRDQVANSPDADTCRLISRQHERRLLAHYGYPPYWGGGGVWGAFGYPDAMVAALSPDIPLEPPKPSEDGDERHLQSTKETTGYHIEAIDGEIGHVDNFLIEEETWRVRHLLVDTSNWIGGKWVVISPSVLSGIDWVEGKMKVDVSRESIRNSRELDAVDLSPVEEAPRFVFI